MANSIPKGGTHLILRLLTLLGFDEAKPRFWIGAGLIRRGNAVFDEYRKMVRAPAGQSRVLIGSEAPVEIGADWLARRIEKRVKDNATFGAHCLYTAELSQLMSRLGVGVVCILRDPRAIAVSHLHYLKRFKRHFFHKAYMALPDDNARIMLTIRGGRIGRYEMRSLGERYRAFSDWQRDPNAVVVRFEDLVGSRGGGSDEAQARAILKVAEHLDISATQVDVKKIQSSLYGASNTFRTGKVDSWRQELTPDQIEALKSEVGETLVNLGYEENAGWVA